MKSLVPVLAAAVLAGCVCDRTACPPKGDCPPPKPGCECGPKCKCPPPKCECPAKPACGPKRDCPPPTCAMPKPGCPDPVMGNWSATLPYDRMSAGSLIFSRGEKGAPKAFVLWRWGSPEWVSDLKVCGPFFSFTHPAGQRFEGQVMGDRMYARIAPCDKKTGEVKGAWQPFEGWRNPPICDKVRTEDAKLGAPIDLLKDGLAGWSSMNAKAPFGWSFKDGVLSNKLERKPDGKVIHGANIVSKRADFFDFNLEYDVRVPKDSNSGVYLRGRFECQVIDSYGKEPDRHNMAAYYGRVAPSVTADKAPGEWQHVSVTLYKGHITTWLNGVKIIDNAKLEGVTGGAIDADLNKTGPIYLQGDHSDADYRNMILRPAL